MKAKIKRKLPDAPKPTKPFLGIDYLEAKKLAALAKHPDLDRQFQIKPKHKWTEEETETIKRLYNSGMSATNIAKEMGLPEVMTRSRVYWMVGKGELEPRTRILTQEDMKKIVKRHNEGASNQQIAKEIGCGATTVGRVLRRAK